MIASDIVRFSWLGLVLLCLSGCGSTAVQVTHPIIATQSTPQKAKVYFIRRDHGFMGVADIPLSVRADGEELLTLTKGQYTLLYLRTVTVDLTVASYTVVSVAGKNTMTRVQTTKRFAFASGETYYFLFAPMPRGFMDGYEFPPQAISEASAVNAARGLVAIGLAIAEPIDN